MGYDLFISYASQDLKFAEALHSRLTDAGFSVWFDKARLNPGCDWHKEIEAGCETARVILPLLTPRWKQSEWTRYETYGHDRVIPLVFEGDFLIKNARGDIDETASVSTPPLRHLQADSIDFQHMDDHAWPRLLETIRSALAAPIPESGTRLTRMRYGHTENFVGREDKLNEIHEKLWTSPTATLTQGDVQIVTALGGVGKTTLARAYADQFWRLYPQVFWVDCRLGIENEFAAVFDLLFPELADGSIDPSLKAKQAFDELNQPTARPMRLLVLDDAPDEQAILSWVPRAGRCHTIVTSRFAGWSNPREVCKVWVLEAEPARKLLLARADRNWEALNSDERAAVDRLAELLGYLPLALEQAAAYIGAPGTSCSFSEYIRRFKTAERHFLAQQQSRGTTEYPASVYATWRTTIDSLPAGSRAILRMAAFMASTPIPQALWVKSASIVETQAWEIGTLPDARPPLDIQVPEWIAALARYSMVTSQFSAEDPTFSVHGLVQAVERHSIASEAVPIWIEKARELLIAYAPDETAENPKTWPIWDVLRPHAETLVELGLADDRVAPNLTFMGALGALYYGKGLYSLDLQLEEKALGIARRTLPPNSGDLAQRLLSYGESLHQLRRNVEAETAFEESLAIREKTDGPDSLRVAEVLNYLAMAVDKQGKLERSETLQRRALAIFEAHPQDADPHSVVKTKHNLAVLLRRKGDYAAAEPLQRWSLEECERVLSPDHPHTLIVLTALADLLDSKGDYAAAESLYRRALETNERVLGPEHPNTLTSVGKLAHLLVSKGDYATAEPLYRRALEADERLLGPEHPNTLTLVNNLADLLGSKGDHAAAEPLHHRALEANERLLGPEHPDTLTSVSNLASLMWSKGDYAAAEPFYRRALAAEERVLGPEHPNTLTSVNNLANLLRSKGDYAAAESLHRRALEAMERVLGPEHPNTLKSVNNLARLLQDKEDLAAAEPLFRRALVANEKTGRTEQPQFAIDLNNHALLLRRLMRFDEAAAFLKRAIGIEDRSLPPDHPKRAHRRNNLAIVCMLADRFDEARRINAEAWSLKAGQHDVTSGRILFARVALCWLRNADASQYLGQLRTLLAQPELPCQGGIDRQWAATDILDQLRSRLSPEEVDLLVAIVAALNEPSKVADLERFDLWHSTVAVPLETPWPNDREMSKEPAPE